MITIFIFYPLTFPLQSNAAEDREFSHLERENQRVEGTQEIITPLEKDYDQQEEKIYVKSTKNSSKKYEISNEDVEEDEDFGYSNFKRLTSPPSDYKGQYKIGKPYKVEGVIYYPQEYDSYEEVGEASWYGAEFDGKATANGEIYDMHDFTAAHRTLPLPSIVRVTNLENGKKVYVRVNDRGPFSRKRILDVSREAATELGFRDQGRTHVKIEYLRDESEELLKQLELKNE